MTTTGAKVALNSRDRPYQAFVVERDIGRPDAAEIILSGIEDDLKLGYSAEIKYGDDTVYSGEIVNISNLSGGNEPAHTRVRAMNLFHRLNQGRRSDVFQKKDGIQEKEIFQRVLERVTKEADLRPVWGDKNPEIVHQGVVLWTNQTPMEFLAMRAERYGYHIWCVGNKLHCRVPDLSQESDFDLGVGGNGSTFGNKVLLPVQSFEPRMSSSQIAKKVVVRGTDPAKGEIFEDNSNITGPRKSSLGKEHAIEVCGCEETSIVDIPVFSKPEAKAVADADFLRRSLTFITAEAVIDLNSKLELGTTVGVSASPNKDPFNGRYYIMGMTHHFTVKHGKQDSYITHLRLARDAQFEISNG